MRRELGHIYTFLIFSMTKLALNMLDIEEDIISLLNESNAAYSLW